MKFSELLRTAQGSLLVNPKRSILTMIGIIIGVSSVVTIISLGNGVKSAALKNLQADSDGRQSTTIMYLPNNQDTNSFGFTDSDIRLIESQENPKIKHVKLRSEKRNVNIQSEINQQSFNLNASLVNKTPKVKVLFGTNITKYDISVKNPVALINKRTAKKYFKNPMNAVSSTITIDRNNYEVVGVFSTEKEETGINNDLLIPENVYFENNTETQGNSLIITMTEDANLSKETKSIVSLLKKKGINNTNGTYEFIDMGQLLQGIQNVITGLTYFISMIAGISLLIAGIGVMNMMYISVSERTKEIGIRLAVGARKKDIMCQFLLESVILTLSGGIIGFIVGALTAYIISMLLPFRAVITINSLILSFSVSSFVGIIFGILPAKQAANKNLIDILK